MYEVSRFKSILFLSFLSLVSMAEHCPAPSAFTEKESIWSAPNWDSLQNPSIDMYPQALVLQVTATGRPTQLIELTTDLTKVTCSYTTSLNQKLIIYRTGHIEIVSLPHWVKILMKGKTHWTCVKDNFDCEFNLK